jgi:hypothetical protein
MCVSDPVSEQLAELQAMLGEGPAHDVLTSAAPVLAGDIDDDEAGRRWPAFTAGAGKLGARAVFAFPLAVGAIRTGQPVTVADLTGPAQRWPRFAAAAGGLVRLGAGPADAAAGRVIGALNLFRTRPGLLDPEELRIGQALADVATIGLLQERNVRRINIAAEQLQAALTSRVIIEQAKGKLAISSQGKSGPSSNRPGTGTPAPSRPSAPRKADDAVPC